MNILVISDSQFITPHVHRYLTEWGHTVTVVSDPVRKIAVQRTAFAKTPPEVVVALSALTITDAQLIGEMFDGMAQRIVIASSVDVYRAYGRLCRTEPGLPDLVPLLEDDPLRDLPVALEETDTVQIERIVSSRPTLPATILRLPNAYGPGDPKHTLYPVLKRMDDHRPAILLGQAYAQWRFPSGYCEDIGYAIAQAARNKKTTGRVYNVADAFAFTMTDWVRAIGRAAGWEGQVIAVSDPGLPTEFAPEIDTEQHWIVDSSRIRQDLGYTEQVPINEAMRRTVAWERENPPMQSDPVLFDYTVEDAILATL